MPFLNPENTNLENGVSNRNEQHVFGSMGQLDPTKFITFFDDFHAPIITGGTQLAGYTDPATGQFFLINDLGGGIDIQTGGVDTNAAIIQTVVRGFEWPAGGITNRRHIWFGCCFELDDVIDSTFIAGLTSTSTSTNPTNGVFFRKDDTSDQLNFIVRRTNNNFAEVNGVATLVNNTRVTVEFYYDLTNTFYYAIDGVPVGSVQVTTTPQSNHAPTIGAVTGKSSTVEVIVDYLFAAEDRAAGGG